MRHCYNGNNQIGVVITLSEPDTVGMHVM